MGNLPEEFNQNCGEILRWTIHLETTLEIFICDYFEIIGSDRKKLFRDLVIYKMSFERKFQIFKKICKEERIPPERINKISINFKFIQEIRNKVAHGQALWDIDNKMKVYKKSSIIEEIDYTEINSALVKEIEEKVTLALKEINNINNELYNKFNNLD